MVIATLNSADTSATIRVTVIGDATRRAIATPGPPGRSAAAGKAKGPRKTKAATPAPAADLPADYDADGAPTAAERAAWASPGVSEEDNPLTPEYRQWVAEQAAAEPADEGRAP